MAVGVNGHLIQRTGAVGVSGVDFGWPAPLFGMVVEVLLAEKSLPHPLDCGLEIDALTEVYYGWPF
jgi:hypothetical protein